MKKFVRMIASYFLMFEGIWHFVVSTVAIVGLIAHHQFGFFAWLTPVWDYLMGVGTFLVGYVFKRNAKEAKK